MQLVIFSFIITMMFIAFYLYSLRWEKERKVRDRIDSYVQLRDPKTEELTALKDKNIKAVFTSYFIIIKNKLIKYYKNTAPTQQEDEIQKRLLRAGSPFKMTVADYYIINNIFKIVVPLLFCAGAIYLKLGFAKIIISFFVGAVLSFKTLDLYISYKTKKRGTKALLELPDFLDILTISVEAGLGFDLALSKTIEKRTGIIPYEFNTCLEEMRLGKSRREALTGVKDRLDFDEMTAFINSVIQSERLGTGIVQTLRTRSEDERDKRKQRAEELAMKTTIKILFPLVFCIFPSIFIILLGPAALQIPKAFGNQ